MGDGLPKDEVPEKALERVEVCCSGSPTGTVPLTQCLKCGRFKGYSQSSVDWIPSRVICTDGVVTADQPGDGAMAKPPVPDKAGTPDDH